MIVKNVLLNVWLLIRPFLSRSIDVDIRNPPHDILAAPRLRLSRRASRSVASSSVSGFAYPFAIVFLRICDAPLNKSVLPIGICFITGHARLPTIHPDTRSPLNAAGFGHAAGSQWVAALIAGTR